MGPCSTRAGSTSGTRRCCGCTRSSATSTPYGARRKDTPRPREQNHCLDKVRGDLTPAEAATPQSAAQPGKGRSSRAFSATGWGLGSWGALIAIRSRSGGWGGAEGGGRAEMRMFYPTFIRHQTRPPQEGAAQGGAFPVCGRGVFSLMMSGVATRARCTASVSTERSLALDPQQRRSRKTSSVDSVRLQQHHLCGLIAVFQLRFLLNRSNASSRKFSALRLKSSSRRARPSSEQDGALQRAARRHGDAKGVLLPSKLLIRLVPSSPSLCPLPVTKPRGQGPPLENRTRQNFGGGGAKQRLNSEAGRERDTTVTWARRGQMELFRVVPGSVDDSAKRARAEPVVDLAALLQATAASSGGCG